MKFLSKNPLWGIFTILGQIRIEYFTMTGDGIFGI
jgi:hypothetical protein